MSPLAVFRADAGAAIGAGHVARCLALADTLADAGWRTAFASRAGTVEAAAGLAASPHAVVSLSGEAADEPREIAAAVDGHADLLVVDHYGRDATFERACRSWAGRVLAIDDFPAEREHAVDLLVDPTPGADAGPGGRAASAGARPLVGAAYAPLRRPFLAGRAAARGRRRAQGDAVRRVFVSFGATDPGGHLPAALAALDGCELDIDVVVGSAAPGLSEVRGRVAGMAARATVHVDVADPAPLMADADLAIGAAGVTALERCCLGLPSLAVVVADNQRRAAEGLAAAGAAQVVDVARDGLGEALDALLRSPERRRDMAQRAAALCDGRGTQRLLCALLVPVPAEDGRSITLRPAEPGDAERLFAWQSDPRTRRFARDPKTPDHATHMAWLDRVLDDPDRLLCIVEHDGTPAGALRLDPLAGGDGREVSIYVAPECYRRGVARAALALARALVPGAELHAQVLPENAASHALFRASGYDQTAPEHYVQRPGATGATA